MEDACDDHQVVVRFLYRSESLHEYISKDILNDGGSGCNLTYCGNREIRVRQKEVKSIVSQMMHERRSNLGICYCS